MRFCRTLGIGVLVCDPRHPQQNGWVERYHRSYGQACLDRYRPSTVEAVRQMTATFMEHYNWQRPHQGVACGNRPPGWRTPSYQHDHGCLTSSTLMAGCGNSMGSTWSARSTGMDPSPLTWPTTTSRAAWQANG